VGLTFPVLVKTGSGEIGMVLEYLAAEEGWDVTLAGSAGGLEFYRPFAGMRTRVSEDGLALESWGRRRA
jgi:hypothetical protein